MSIYMWSLVTNLLSWGFCFRYDNNIWLCSVSKIYEVLNINLSIYWEHRRTQKRNPTCSTIKPAKLTTPVITYSALPPDTNFPHDYIYFASSSDKTDCIFFDPSLSHPHIQSISSVSRTWLFLTSFTSMSLAGATTTWMNAQAPDFPDSIPFPIQAIFHKAPRAILLKK